MLNPAKVRQAAAAAATATATAVASSASAAAASRSPLPIPSLAPKPPRRSILKAAATKAARRSRAARQGFDVEGPKLTFLEQERLLRAEIAELERKLESTTQAESSKQATENLPPLDELTLEQLYHALTLPEPLTPAEERLLLLDQRRSVKRALGIEAPAATESPALSDPERIQLRLRALESRITGISLANDTELVQRLTDERHALADRVGQLITAEQTAETGTQDEIEGQTLPTRVSENSERHAFHELMSEYASKGEVAQCQNVLQQMELAGCEANPQTYHWLVKAHLRAGNTLIAMQTITALEETPTPAHMSTYTLLIDHLINHPSTSRAVQSAAWSIFYHMRLAVHPIPDAPLYALMLHACAQGVPQPSDVIPISKKTLPVVRAVRKIRKAGEPDAARALDLFREMTTAYSVSPNAEIYNNILLACCRSGERQYYHEAFRLLRQMLQRSEEASKVDETLAGVLWSPDSVYTEDPRSAESGKASTLRFTPDRYTFHAFLQGCARHGDLARARWVLAEMIRAASYFQRTRARMIQEGLVDLSPDDPRMRHLIELDECRPSSETLAHVFYAYASYQPPMQRQQVKVVGKRAKAMAREEEKEEEESKKIALETHTGTITTQAETGVQSSPEEESQPTDINTTEDEAASTFTLEVPQTSAEVLRELRALVARVIADREAAASSTAEADTERTSSVLSTVQPSVFMLNAYLSAVMAHSSPADRFFIFEQAIAPLLPENQSVIGEADDPSETSFSNLVYGTTSPEHGLFARLGLRPNTRTYQIGLELCGNVNTKVVGSIKDERPGAVQSATASLLTWRDVRVKADQWWREWRELDAVEDAESKLQTTQRPKAAISDAKRRERAWAARIRHLAKFYELDESVAVLQEFSQLYPPRRPGQPQPAGPASTKDKSQDSPSAGSNGSLPAEAVPKRQLRLSRTSNTAKTAAGQLSLPMSLLNGIGPLSVPPEAYAVLHSTGQSAHLERERKRQQEQEQLDHHDAVVEAEGSGAMSDSVGVEVTDSVRPGLTFHDLELLHHRLVDKGGKTVRKGIDLVNWAGKAYEAQKRESW
ncbi:unnamed protein product [Tilletia controversa]|uniref:Uncharacterized protein n=3 Tax=Tilletia TaxID=13289 RepID=A0A8X7MM40_9BASI|nr:hypothetical protein CF328_g6515 [Tilletia controversa]KAE8190966.1 hypothetical protein CF336_g5077 [Tilletia laevis]KAE8258190.1 hypothetical protein A4X03_0g4456 [Tilletia caries]KAE8198200.1 hypothetical protein CF335_g4437 [Tilletia laevis]KAE8241915.1 hypothetical protein A4X06_0g7353 [Tilletia controversa]